MHHFLILILTFFGTSVFAAAVDADEAYLEFFQDKAARAIVSLDATHEGYLVFVKLDSTCQPPSSSACKVQTRLPVTVDNFRFGGGVGVNFNLETVRYSLHQWRGHSLKDFYGTYRGVSGGSLDLSAFYEGLDVQLADIVAINRHGIIVDQGPSAGGDQQGLSVDVMSYRSLKISPRLESGTNDGEFRGAGPAVLIKTYGD